LGDQKGIRPVKTSPSNSLGRVVNVSGWGIPQSKLLATPFGDFRKKDVKKSFWPVP